MEVIAFRNFMFILIEKISSDYLEPDILCYQNLILNNLQKVSRRSLFIKKLLIERMCACVRACMRVCMCACTRTYKIYT